MISPSSLKSAFHRRNLHHLGFRGADLTIFGAIEGFDERLLAQGKYNLVTVLEGPKDDATVRKKERVFGIWVNRHSMTFELVPESYSLATTRDISQIAPPQDIANMGIGVDHMRLIPTGFVGNGSNLTNSATPSAAFASRAASTSAIPRRAVHLFQPFKASIRLPADVPNGIHLVRAYLFRDGTFVAAKALPLRVVKTGLEEAITRAAPRTALPLRRAGRAARRHHRLERKPALPARLTCRFEGAPQTPHGKD